MLVWRIIRSVLFTCCLLAALVACAGGTAPTAVPTPETSPPGAITLVLWHGWSGPARQALTRLVDRFNQAHPATRIFAQSMPLASMGGDLRAAAAAGTGPHLILLPSGWVGGLASEQVLLPLDTLVPTADQRALLPVTLGTAQAQGHDKATHLYGLPVNFDTTALFYNNANVLAPPASTADMFNLAHGLSEADANPPRWGLALNLSVEATIGYLYAFDGRVFDEQGALVLGGSGRKGTERWLEWLADLNGDPQLLARPNSSVEIDRNLKNGQALMTFGWAHQLGEYQQLWGDKLGVAPLPKLAETNRQPVPYVQSDLLAVNARASAAEQSVAVAFMRFMVSEEAQRELLSAEMQPANNTIKLDGNDTLNTAARVFRQQAERAQPLPNGVDRATVRDELWQMQRAVLEGRTTPADAVSEADARLRAALLR